MAWRYVIDGADVTSVTMDKSITRRLNRPWSAKCRIPSELTSVALGDRVKIYDDSDSLFFHGVAWLLEDSGDEDVCYTTMLAYDPMILWRMRPCRDADGDFSYPSFLSNFQSGPQIMEEILANSQTWEGTLFLDMAGTVETGGADLSGTPVDWPMTVGEMWSLLADTGMVDVVLDPIESGSLMARFNAYNGDYGTDLSGSVAFQYGIGANNVRRVRRSQDMSTMCNKLYYYLGPKKQTADDPDAVQHWRTNVTGDHPSLPNPPGGDIDYPNPLGDAVNASRSDYWVSMDIRIFDSALDSGTDAVTAQLGTDALFLRLWQAELSARVRGRELAHITPVRGLEPAFDIGDLVSVQAGSVLRGGFSGTQRVYEYTVNIDNDGVTEIAELVTSADQESL
jgi:hypothetical protein